MKNTFSLALAAAVLGFAAGPATAGELRLSMANGRVTLLAHDVTVREILAEWARVGQARIVNGDKVLGTPVTLELQDVPEGQALDAVLRSAAAGYVMVPRVAGAPGLSRYDRIMILASSRPPAVTAAPPQPFGGRNIPMQVQQTLPADEDDGEPRDQGNQPPTPGPGPLGMPGPQFQGQPGQINQAPMTSPRPGMLPAPTGPGVPPNPYLLTPPPPPPQPSAPGPQQPVRRPGGGGSGER